MSAAQRKEFAAKAASQRWVWINTTQSAIGGLREKDGSYDLCDAVHLDKTLDANARELAKAGGSSPTVKDIEKSIKSLEAKNRSLEADQKRS